MENFIKCHIKKPEGGIPSGLNLPGDKPPAGIKIVVVTTWLLRG